MAPMCRVQLVRFTSQTLDQDEDPLIKWLTDLNFWDVQVKYRIKAADRFMPLDIEYQFKSRFGLPLDCDVKNLFSGLLCSCTGMLLKPLGFGDGGYEDPCTCVGKILSLKLGRVQDRVKLKALKIAFDPRAQFLVGARSVPYA